MAALLALSLVLGVSNDGMAAERVWDGGARDDGWNAIGNWIGVGVPAAGDSVHFPAGALHTANKNVPADGLFQFIDTSASNLPMRVYRAVSP